MSEFEQRYELSAYAPGAYLYSLQTKPCTSLAEKAQIQACIKQIKRLKTDPQRGAAWFPLIKESQVGSIIGVLAKMNTARQGISLSSERQESVRQWLSRLLGDIPVEIPSLYIENVPPLWEIQGHSWGLAAIVSVISTLIQCAPNASILCSGALCPNSANLLPVSKIHHKRQVCQWENPETDPFLCERIMDITLYLNRTFGKKWKPLLLQSLKITPRAMAEEAHSQYRLRNANRAARIARDTLKLVDPNSNIHTIIAHLVLGSLAKHETQSKESVRHLMIARDMIKQSYEKDQMDIYLRFQLEANLGIAMLQTLQVFEAIQIVEQALRELEAFPIYFRDLKWRNVGLRLGGTLRWLYVAAGEPRKAELIQQEWPLKKARVPQQVCRCYYNLSDVYWRQGLMEDALLLYEKAGLAFADVRPVDRPVTKRYLSLMGVRLKQERPEITEYRWPSSLLEQLEVLEYSLHIRSFDAFIEEYVPLDKLNLFELFVLSGFAARNIIQGDPHDTSLKIAHRLQPHADKMHRKMQRALNELCHGSGEGWALLNPY